MLRDFVLFGALTASFPVISAWSYIATSCDRLPPKLHDFVTIDTFTRIKLPPSATEKAKFVVKSGLFRPFQFLYSTRLADVNCAVPGWPVIHLRTAKFYCGDVAHDVGLVRQTNNTDEISFLFSLVQDGKTAGVTLVGDMKPDQLRLTPCRYHVRDEYIYNDEWEFITADFTNQHPNCTMVIQVLSESARLEKVVFQPRSQSCYPEEPGTVYRSGNVTVLDITRIDLSTGKKEVTLAVNRNESLSFIVYIRPNDTRCRLNETRVLLSSGDCAFASSATRSNYALRHVQRVIEQVCRLPRSNNKYDRQADVVTLTITPDNPECLPMIEFPSYSARLIVADTEKDTSHASSMIDVRYLSMIVTFLSAAVIV